MPGFGPDRDESKVVLNDPIYPDHPAPAHGPVEVIRRHWVALLIAVVLLVLLIVLVRFIQSKQTPAAGDPGLQRVSISGEEPKGIAKGDIDHVCQFGSDLWFSIGGSLNHVTSSGGGEQEVAKLPHAVLELAATDDALYALLRQDAGGHLLVRLPRSAPEGSRP